MAEQNFAKDTSKRTAKQWAQGILVLLTGLIIAHLGVTLFVLTELGTDTFTIFVQGIARTVGLSIGTCHVIILICLMAVMALTTKGYVKLGTIVCAFCGGWIIDFFMWLLKDWINEGLNLPLRVAVMAAGCIILSLGMSIVIKSNSGTGPNDLIAMILTDKLNQRRKVSFRSVRIACDVFFTVTGILLGGTVGIGTVAAIFLTGPVVQFFLPRSEAVIHKVFSEI